MKQIFAWLFAAIFFAAGCAHSPELAEPVRGTGYEDADGLVIVAACPPATRTDIEEGKSTWEAGDRITVVYDGAAYEYTAAEAGPTTAFTSEAGIADYDASKPLTAYYPATTAEGVVAVEAERTIALDAESQSNPARAPLVGLPTSGNLAEGALEVTFRNIFSVIELRIDAGELASAAQSLTVEPADEAAFEGFLSFEGTVDPETLALTPAENGTGNSLVFNFAEGVDLTKPQTIKFPVGRFRSEAGLRLTLGTADGKSYSKNIYKTGITSYAEQGGVFRAKHMAKALYAFAPQGGISTADDLIEFAAAVNAGETLAPWQDDKGVVVLLDDIDLAEVTEWTPIGAATSKLANNALSITSGRPFTGYFDGQGHTIRNLKMVCKAAQATSAWGFFGAVADGAVVENLIFDASCSLEDKATAGTDCGVVAGLVYEATVRNVVNKASIAFDGAAPDNIRMTIGMVGLAFADKNGARLEKLVNHGALTATSGGNTKNGATGIHVGGIVGFSSNKSNTTAVVTIAECTNYGDLDTQVARASGIVAAANRYTEIENCVNEGDNVNAFATVNSARIGNITCITAAGSKITNTVNRGNVICKTSGAAGGVVCLVNDDGNAFVGCENYGLVITDRASYKGTLFGQCNKAARFSDCIAQGDLGAYEDGSYALVGVNYTNYMSYIGDHNASAVHVNSQNILYYPNGSQVPAEPEFGVNLSSVELNAQGSNAAVVQLSSVDYDWTVSADGDWVHVTDLSDAPVVSGVRDSGVQYIKIGAGANTKTAPRSAVVTFASTDGAKSATVKVDQQARGEAFPSKWGVPSFDAAALRLVVDRRQRHSRDVGRGGLHFGRARRCERFGRFQAERRYEPSCGFDDGRGRLLALYLPGGESRRRIGRRFQRHDGGRSQFAQILHRRIPRRRSLEERRGRSAHGSGKPGGPLYLQVFGHCHRVLVSARDRHADDALRKRRDRRRSENPLPRRGSLHLRGRYAEHHGDQRRQLHSSLRIYGQLRAELRHGDAPRHQEGAVSGQLVLLLQQSCVDAQGDRMARRACSQHQGSLQRVADADPASVAGFLDRGHRTGRLRFRFPAGPEPESRQLWPRRHGVDPHGPYDLGRQGARRVAFVQGDSGGDVDLLVGVLRRIYRFPDLRDL